MTKEITINFSHVKHEYLVRFFEDGKLVNWKIFNDSKDITAAISKFYHPQ